MTVYGYRNYPNINRWFAVTAPYALVNFGTKLEARCCAKPYSCVRLLRQKEIDEKGRMAVEETRRQGGTQPGGLVTVRVKMAYDTDPSDTLPLNSIFKVRIHLNNSSV